MRACFVGILAVLAATAAAGGPSYSCHTDANTSFVSNTCTLDAPHGLTPGSNVTIVLQGQTTKQIVAGTFKYQVYESGVKSFVASGFASYFQCDNKGCYTNEPIALQLVNPNVIPSAYTGVIPVIIPKPQATGLFTIDFVGSDQDHYPYDISGSLVLQQTCTTDADCPSNSYCMNGPGQSPPYICH